ncbi:MAG: hypothetical protein EBX40_01665 [Gammaproteobacteria bacterium]|nr:hypothetical protein [Gammaproteobacteria bacterium]
MHENNPNEILDLKMPIDEQLKSQFLAGFNAAIELLKNPDQDEFNAGITSCMHSHEWAAWLESKKC